jgi:DNA-binding XRE family transcriptional regulator
MGRKAKTKRDPYGAWLVHLRDEVGLSQDELARELNVAQQTVAHWERTGKLPGRELIVKLSKTLKVSIEEVLRVK